MMRKRTLAIVLALALTLSAALCGCNEKTDNAMSVMVFSTRSNFDELTQKKTLEERYDGTIKWYTINNISEQVGLMFASGDYTDVVISNLLQDSDIAKYASQGVLIPLEDYINEETTPNLIKFFEKVPSAKAVSTMTDGHIYSLPRYNGMESDFVENVMFINKTWLDKLGLQVPTTTEELYSVLKAFREKDPNGNGKVDEIPMSFHNGHPFSYPEALLSCWGSATKHGNFEGFLTIHNGEVQFAPETEAWKEMIKYYNRLYSEKLLDMEVFTQNNDQFLAKLGAETSIVGVTWSKSNPFANQDEYVAIPPLHAPGYETVWRVHPGSLGIKNLFSITNKCTDVKAAMKWVDKFYTMEATLEDWYGPVGEVFNVENGIYKFNTPPEGKTIQKWVGDMTISGVNLPGVFYKDGIGTVVEDNAMWTQSWNNYLLYKDYLDKETWPRPYYSLEDTDEITKLRTDIFSIVEKSKANWIVGNSNIDNEWATYLESLKSVGIEEYLKINQETYDKFKNAK